MPFSPIGRRRLWPSTLVRLWPILFPIARFYRRRIVNATRLITIIGSLGKTTTARAVSAALGQSPHEIQGWNGGGFLARAVFRIRRGQRHAVMEVGISRPGRMRRYRRLLSPNVVVVTSISSEHHRTLGSLAEIRAEKSEMLRGLPESATVVANGDDPHVAWMVQHAPGRVVSYGFGRDNAVRATGYQPRGLQGSQFILHLKGRQYDVASRLIGQHMVYPLLAAFAVAAEEGKPLVGAVARLAELSPTQRRLKPKSLPNGAHLLMDDYKSVIDSVESALDVLESLRAQHPMVVLGEVYESPMSDEETYSWIGRRLGRAACYVVFVGSSNRFDALRKAAIQAGLSQACIQYAQRSVHDAATHIEDAFRGEDIVLIKGFGEQRLERIHLLLKGATVTCRRTACKMPMIYACGTCPLVDR